MQDVSLANVNFALNSSFDEDHDNPLYSVVTSLSVELSDERDAAIVWMDADIEWSAGEDGEVRPPFDLSLTLKAAFDWALPDVEPGDVVSWLTYNTQHLVWPYLRSYVQQITAMSDLPPLVIFTISVPSLRETRPVTDIH
ncbi:protein-export chaperone SecB [Patulibacter medicamentivorans]|uniref:protein-export chaperone SecB n=1 Tax=Patulibacter medicamentivorans TaxID=1097667 RepID=UPI0011105EBD|nr:protein-export chaperone SecB [Patulibacter medicamentivorans]